MDDGFCLTRPSFVLGFSDSGLGGGGQAVGIARHHVAARRQFDRADLGAGERPETQFDRSAPSTGFYLVFFVFFNTDLTPPLHVLCFSEAFSVFFIKVFDCFCSKLTRVAELFVFFSIQRRTLLSFFFFCSRQQKRARWR